MAGARRADQSRLQAQDGGGTEGQKRGAANQGGAHPLLQARALLLEACRHACSKLGGLHRLCQPRLREEGAEEEGPFPPTRSAAAGAAMRSAKVSAKVNAKLSCVGRDLNPPPSPPPSPPPRQQQQQRTGTNLHRRLHPRRQLSLLRCLQLQLSLPARVCFILLWDFGALQREVGCFVVVWVGVGGWGNQQGTTGRGKLHQGGRRRHFVLKPAVQLACCPAAAASGHRLARAGACAGSCRVGDGEEGALIDPAGGPACREYARQQQGGGARSSVPPQGAPLPRLFGCTGRPLCLAVTRPAPAV